MELQVLLLAKVDGTVACWTELWGTPANLVRSVRVARLGDSSEEVTLPGRLRLLRQVHFEGSAGKAWAKQPNALERAETQLAEQGLSTDCLIASTRVDELVRAVTA